ncbi:MAG: type II toxin-antitoxin system VapC family toxin [Gammaproteobacteria bacterium]
MKAYLLDTNILIYYFNGNMDSLTEHRVSSLMSESFHVSVISKMEFLGFPFADHERHQAAQLISYAKMITLNADIVDRVIAIRQEKRMKLPDAIIAATAMQNSMTLVTRNIKDFASLELDFLNPFE